MDDHHDVNLRAGEVPDGRQPSSTRPYHTRLDATSGREVVYCFKCDGEWYRDEHGIMPCPACHNDVTEVVEVNDDPRPPPLPSSRPPRRYTLRRTQPQQYAATDNESDPDEEDISVLGNQHADHGMRHSGNINPNNTRPAGAPQHPFSSMLASVFSTAVQGVIQHQPGRPGSQDGGDNQQRQGQRRRDPTLPFGVFGSSVYAPGGPLASQEGPVVYTRAVHIGPNGNRIVYTSAGRSGAGDNAFEPALVLRFLQDMAAGANATPGQAPRVDHPAQPAIMALINSLTALNVGGGSGQVGDYVYTPEAFDRILTHLMNSGANGPPPAPREALDALPNKKIDDSMLDDEGKAKCSICMADVREPNDEGIINEYVCELPCKHWFHEDCVKEWLKSHDSCPICRKPIVNHDGNAHAHPAPPSGGPSYGGNGGNGGGNDGAGPSNGGSSYHPPGSFPQDRGDGAGGSSGGNSNGNGGRSNSFFGSWFYRNNSNNSRAQSAQSNDASSRSQQAVQGTSTGGGSQQSMAIFQALRQHRSNVNPGFLTAHNSALNARPTNVGRRAISFVRYPPIHDTDYATNTQAVVEDMEYEGEVDGLPVGGEVTELSEGSVRSESGLGVAGGAGAGAAGPGAVNGCVGALRLVRRVRTRNITSKSSPYARPAASDNAQHGTAEQAYGNAMMRFFRQNGGARRS